MCLIVYGVHILKKNQLSTTVNYSSSRKKYTKGIESK